MKTETLRICKHTWITTCVDLCTHRIMLNCTLRSCTFLHLDQFKERGGGLSRLQNCIFKNYEIKFSWSKNALNSKQSLLCALKCLNKYKKDYNYSRYILEHILIRGFNIITCYLKKGHFLKKKLDCKLQKNA